MKGSICQSCGMPMDDEKLFGTNKDQSPNTEYCTYCYQNGAFPDPDMSLEQMIEVCVPHMVEGGMSESEARGILNNVLPGLKRWTAK